MSMQPSDELEPRLQQKYRSFTFNMGCFPTLCIIFGILAIIVLYPIVTHPPIDYVHVVLILIALCIPLLLFMPRFRPFSERHPLLATMTTFTPMAIITIYPVVAHSPVDYIRLLQVLLAFSLLVAYVLFLNTPTVRTITRRYPAIFIPVTMLMLCIGYILYNVYPHPDYAGLMWASLGIIGSYIWLGRLLRHGEA